MNTVDYQIKNTVETIQQNGVKNSYDAFRKLHNTTFVIRLI